MKFYICPDDPDVIAAENIDEAKKNICGSCKCKCNGPKEVASSDIPMIKASKNLLINTGNYIHEMKQCIKELISAIDNSTFCKECYDKDCACSDCPNSTFCKECCDKDCACSDCPWFKAKSRGLELLKEAEE